MKTILILTFLVLGVVGQPAQCPEGEIFVFNECIKSRSFNEDHHDFNTPGECELYCPNGPCVNGKCRFSNFAVERTWHGSVSDDHHGVSSSKQCPFFCPNGPCVDRKCRFFTTGKTRYQIGKPVCPKFCPPGHSCMNGVCLPSKVFTGYIGKTRYQIGKPVCPKCPEGQKCVNGVCLGPKGFVVEDDFNAPGECELYCPNGPCVNGKCRFSNFNMGRTWRESVSEFLKNYYEGARRLQACSTGADCGSQSVCVDGKCVVDNGHGGLCSVGAHCPNGYTCIDSKCVKSKRQAEKKKAIFCSIFCKFCKNGVCLE